MILPIYAFGQPVLKKIADEIGPDYPGLPALLQDMWETMHTAEGVGLAAPQIGLGIRLFIVDTNRKEDDEDEKEDKAPKQDPLKAVFINAQMLTESGKPWAFEEGCLSIPDIRGDVERQPVIRIRWQDENFTPHEATFDGLNARVIQHEYDHIQGVLFTEKLKPLKRRLIQRKLEKIRKGDIELEYKMRFVKR